MGQDTGVPGGTMLDRLDRLLADERSRTDSDRRQTAHMLGQIALGLARTEMRLMSIETRLARRMSPEKLVKLVLGIGLPILVLVLTGNLEAALKVIGALL